MIRETATRPDARRREIENTVTNVVSRDAVAKAFGAKVNNNKADVQTKKPWIESKHTQGF